MRLASFQYQSRCLLWIHRFVAIALLTFLTACGETDNTPEKIEDSIEPTTPELEVAEPDPPKPTAEELKLVRLKKRHAELLEQIDSLKVERDAIDSPFRNEDIKKRTADMNRLAELKTKVEPLKTEHQENVKKMKELEKRMYNVRNTETGRTVRTINVNVRKQRNALRKRRLTIEKELRAVEPEYNQLREENTSRTEFLNAVQKYEDQIKSLQEQMSDIEDEMSILRNPG